MKSTAVHISTYIPSASASKQANALTITSSGSVPLSFSPNKVRNMVKLMGPGALLIMSSKYCSVGFLPGWEKKKRLS